MTMNLARARKLLERSALAELFVEELGWDHHAATLTLPCDGCTYTLHGIVQKRGMAVLTCAAPNGTTIPSSQQRNAIEAHVARMLHEHVIIFTSADYADQVWQWVRKQPGRPITRREHRYRARGVKLWPSDLVRNYVFLEATRHHGSQAKVKDLYDTYWRHYDETATAAFWKEHVRQGRMVNPRFELFLFHFLTSKLKRPEDDIQLQHLYRSFCEWWDASEGVQPRDVEQVLQEIQFYSAFYYRLFEHRDDDRLATFGRRLRIMDVSTIYPLVLFLFVEREQETAAEMDGILTDLESYLVRRLICGLTTKSYNRIFVKLLTDLRKAGSLSRDVIQQHLLTLTGPTAEWPSNDLLRECWLTSPVYQNLRQSRIVMILEALEWQQYGSKQEHQRPPSTTLYTIEHILPQNPSEEDWPLPLPADVDEETRHAIIMTRETLKHTIGNLTLVTSSMNSGLGNHVFAQKRHAFDTQSTLMLSKYFIKHGIDTWGEGQIRERGERLLTEAITIWPRP